MKWNWCNDRKIAGVCGCQWNTGLQVQLTTTPLTRLAPDNSNQLCFFFHLTYLICIQQSKWAHLGSNVLVLETIFLSHSENCRDFANQTPQGKCLFVGRTRDASDHNLPAHYINKENVWLQDGHQLSFFSRSGVRFSTHIA